MVSARKSLLSMVAGVCLTTGIAAQDAADAVTGWRFTPMPNLNYNTDVGLSLGAFCDFFNYGDGSGYPNFKDHVGVTLTWSSKGAHYAHILGESESLIPGLKLVGSLTYRQATANNFYGFNGYYSPYDPSLDKQDGSDIAYYNNERELMRASALVLGPMPGFLPEALKWTAGLLLRSIRFQDHTIVGRVPGSVRSLFHDYKDAGLIPADQASGGVSLEGRAGLTWDSRDIEWVPSRGIYAELYLNANADLSDGRRNYGQIVAHWRHYVPLWANRMTLAYHLGFQQEVFGHMPWYNLNEISTLTYLYEESEGLGSRYSMRGLRYNRIMAAGYAWGNFELRTRIYSFDLLRRHFDLVLNPFFDAGTITRFYRLDEQKALPAFYTDSRRRVFMSAGLGAKFHMNTNFIMSLEAGRGFDNEVGALTFSMATTYLF